MSTDPQTLIIQLLGKTYPIKCPPEKISELQYAAIQLDKEMRKIVNSNNQLNLEQTAIMAALNFSYELITTLKTPRQTGSLDELQSIENQIDDVLVTQEEL